jgi:hypothetical protein
MRGLGVRSTESMEWRGKSSWSWAEDEDDEDMEKREEARERDPSESELSRRSGAAERSDTAALDARPPFRWRSSSFRDLAAEELDALDGVAGTGDGDGEGDADAGVFFSGVWTFLSRSSSRQRLEHVGALGENTYGSNASATEGRNVFTSSGVAGISAAGALCGSGSGSAAVAGCGRSGSSLPSANSSSAGSMVPDPPKLNSKSMNSLDTAAACSALHADTSP